MRLVSKGDYWPCACFRHRKGKPTQVKLHHPATKRCRVCGMTRAQVLAAERKDLT